MDKFQSKSVADQSNGLTLISVLVATSIFVTVLLAVIRLMTGTTQATLISHDKFIGTNLAREGIELAQAVRDNNWMSSVPGRARADWVKNGLCYGLLEDDKKMTLDTDNYGTILVNLVPPLTDAKLYIDDSGQYHHNLSGAVASPYSRVISIDCSASQNKYTNNDDPPLLRYITITSTVNWERDHQNHEVSLMTRLYDWY